MSLFKFLQRLFYLILHSFLTLEDSKDLLLSNRRFTSTKTSADMSSDKSEHEFESILKMVGDYGRYQKLMTYSILVLSSMAVAIFTFHPVFVAHTPDHWCHVPDVFGFNLTFEEQKTLTVPTANPTCSTYDVNYTQLLETDQWMTSNKTQWPTKKCSHGWRYDTSNYDATIVTKWNLVCDDAYYSSTVVSLFFAGDVIGTLISGHFSDKFGRKKTLVVLVLITGLSELASVFVTNFPVFLVLRAVNGAAAPSVYILVYILLLEMVGASKRSMINMIACMAWTLGLCILPLLAWFCHNWAISSFVTSSLALALSVCFMLIQESPRWLLTQERYDETEKILIKIAKFNEREKVELYDLQKRLKKIGDQMKLEKEKALKVSILDLVRYPRIRKTFIFLTISWIGSAVAYFGLHMNVENLVGNPFLNFLLLALVEAPSHLCTWFLLERVGRRWISTTFLAITGIVLLLPVVYHSGSSNVGIVASLVGKFASSASFMTIYQQAPELYPTPLRSIGMSTSVSISNSASLVTPYIVGLAKVSRDIPFIVFSFLNFCGVICAFLLPETRNKKLPQTIADAENFGVDVNVFPCCRKTKELPSSAKDLSQQTRY